MSIRRPPLRVDDVIWVRIGEADERIPWESSVEGIAADEMLIRWPTAGGDRIPIVEHQQLTISFVRSQTAYEFEAKVLNKSEDPLALLAVRPTSSTRTIQRRNDLRVRAPVPVVLEANVVGINSYRTTHRGVGPIRASTETISGGGFAILHSDPIRPGTQVTARLTLPGENRQPLNAVARVVHCEALAAPEDEDGQFQVGFEFIRISEAARSRIVRFVFGVERACRHPEE